MRTLLLATAALLLVALAACGDDDDSDATPTGSPTSAIVEPAEGTLVFSANPAGQFDIFSMPANGGEATALIDAEGDDLEPSVSPDGTRLAYQGQSEEGRNIFFANIDGSDAEVFKPGPAVEGGVRWQPSGNGYAYYSFEADVLGLLWFADQVGANDYPVLDEITADSESDNCTGGFPGDWISEERILFRGGSGTQGALQLCAINRDKTDFQVIFSQPGSKAYNPDVSPSGELIALTLQPENQASADIYIVGVGGQNLAQVTSLAGNELNPTWSPDGKWIAFASNEEGDFEIYIVHPDGTGLRKLTDNSYDDQEPYWVPVVSD